MKISLRSQIAPHFWKTFLSKKPHQIDSGGRGSTKTSKNALKTAYTCISEENCSAIIIRKTQKSLRDSVYKEIKRALTRLGLVDGVDYISNVSPMKIRLWNGNTIYFAGLDDYEKVKGFIDETRPIKIVWFEEITEFSGEEELQQVVATFSRGNNDWFITLYSYNPPKNKFDWVNEWVDKVKEQDGYSVVHTDYRTVPKEWLGKMFLEEAERLKKYDNKRYRWIYLGEVIGIDGVIFNYDLISIADKDYIEKNKLRCIYLDLALDVGYSTSATTCLAIGYMTDGNWYLLDTYYSSPQENIKKSPSELADDFVKFRIAVSKKYNAIIDQETCDSAETALPLELEKKYGIRIHKVNKGTDKEEQIDFAQDFLSRCKFKVLDNSNNKIFLKEIKNYKWKKDSVEKGKPIPDKEEKEMPTSETYFNTYSNLQSYYYADHTCDAFIYWVLDNKQKIGISDRR